MEILFSVLGQHDEAALRLREDLEKLLHNERQERALVERLADRFADFGDNPKPFLCNLERFLPDARQERGDAPVRFPGRPAPAAGASDPAHERKSRRCRRPLSTPPTSCISNQHRPIDPVAVRERGRARDAYAVDNGAVAAS